MKTRLIVTYVAVLITCLAVFTQRPAVARWYNYGHHQRTRNHCDRNSVAGTVYNTPHESDRASWSGFRTFRAAVRMQGSGIDRHGNVVHYNGQVERNTCPTFFGDVTVQAGGLKGNCLIPFISVASDPSVPRGTIIEIPEIAEAHKEVTLPPKGIRRVHPGLFMVQDRGAWIQGRGRLDFYTGSDSNHNPTNIFASGPSPFRMDRHTCDKTFRLIPPELCSRNGRGRKYSCRTNPEYAQKFAEISAFINGSDLNGQPLDLADKGGSRSTQ